MDKLRNYLTVSLRSLLANRSYTAINVVGLAVGMAACLAILMFVRHERSFDAAVPNAANTYQLQTWYASRETGREEKMQMASYIAGQRLKKDFPEVERIVYALGARPVVLRQGQASTVEKAVFVDGPFFDTVRLPFRAGDPATALSRPGTVVLSEAEARRQFGTVDAIGRTLTLVSQGRATDYRVTGVMRDLPRNSNFNVTLIARFDLPTYFADNPEFMESWGWQSGWYYLNLKPGTDPASIEARLPAWEKRNIEDEPLGNVRYNAGDDQDYHLERLTDLHLGPAQHASMVPGNDARTIATFSIIALLILGMACVNFTNLATARAGQRAREVALRKVLGASRGQLVAQFIGESIVIAAIAMLVALVLVELTLPTLADFLSAELEVRYFGAGGILLPSLLLVLLVGVVGGAYPALVLSRFRPASVLKANRSGADAPGSARLRTVLVVGQFAVSIGLIVCTAVIYLQTRHARSVDPGFDRANILQVDIGRRQLSPIVPSLVERVRRLPGVLAVGTTGIGINTRNNSNRGVQLPGRTELVSIGSYPVGPDFFETMKLRLLAGRLLERDRPADDASTPLPVDPAAERALAARGANTVINRLAAERLGFADPRAAIGKSFTTTLSDGQYGTVPMTIVGVIENSRFRSVRDPVDPMFFWRNDNAALAMIVRYQGAPAAVRGQVERVARELAPDVPFEAEFSEDIVRELYERETARAQLFAAFALLSVLIGCLGLFGLAAFTAERRTKEIGIRKVLGARTRDIVRLLVWQFSQPVIVANLIAWPIAWWVMRGWLSGFEDRMTLGPAPFLLAGLLALGIAVATVTGHAVRIARANPIQALRYE